MPGTHDLDAVIHAAAEAFARKDHGLTERLLRQALVLQEQSVGRAHPEVAKTLNNLAIICELNDKPGDAETCYRRALEIASACLPSDDPLVRTSRENIDEFYKATEFATERAPTIAAMPRPLAPEPRSVPGPVAPQRAAAPAPSRPVAPPSLDDLPLRHEPRAPLQMSHAVPARAASRVWPIIAVATALLIPLAAAAWYLIDSSRAANRTASLTPVSSGVSPSSAPSPAPAEPSRELEPETATAVTTPVPPPDPEAPPEAPAPPSPAVDEPTPVAAATATSSSAVIGSALCLSLVTSGAWTCTPATGTLSPGTIIFYTRVASTSDTTIEHRWYRDGRVQQSVPLRIRANPSGFRTYSRSTITPDRAGDWKVELRTEDGTLLDEKTFTVQP